MSLLACFELDLFSYDLGNTILVNGHFVHGYSLLTARGDKKTLSAEVAEDGTGMIINRAYIPFLEAAAAVTPPS